jgi:hypothetical protein
MKEYESIATQVSQFAATANGKAAEGWRVVSVLPDQYVAGTKLTQIVIFFERDQ